MYRSIFICTLLLLCSCFAFTQTSWQVTSAPSFDRYDDIYFIDADHGWAIAPYTAWIQEYGGILRTTDGGANWETQVDSVGALLRCVGFFDDSLGYIGVLEDGLLASDTAMMMRTTDGGASWDPVNNLPGPRPGGICGMHLVNDSLMYAVGRYYGPAGIWKSEDKGMNWTYSNVDSLAGGLVDVHFWHPDSGIVIGSAGIPFADSAGVIIQTDDGGQSWRRVYTTINQRRILWKIAAPSRNRMYVSIQPFNQNNAARFIKTKDGGQTWSEGNFASGGVYSAQGIGFVNDSVGWVGGHYQGTTNFMTTTGGASWSNDNWGTSINRFRFLNDSLGFACGSQIWKFTGLVQTNRIEGLPEGYAVSLIYPSPSEGKAAVDIELPQRENVVLRVRDLQGHQVLELPFAPLPKGKHQLRFELEKVAAGMYWVEVALGKYKQTLRFSVMK